uniref:Scm like with four mbt domains 2 n=1 Tax=Scleropages formosus TaxID=113540 RepID=A0A8C9W6Z4_SCLFO
MFSSVSDGDFIEEDVDFNWEEYLEENEAVAAPHSSFKHVEISLQSSFQPGMKLEVANKSSPDTYWVATIITTCGQLLLLRFCGYGEERKADFWCDVMTANLHPIGWCAQNNKVLMPPEAIKERYSDWAEFLIQELTGSRTAPANLLEGPLRGKNTVDLITPGSLLELQDLCEPILYWPVRVMENMGGRLRLRYAGLESDDHDTWLFYLDVRLRPVGWSQENHYTMEPPSGVLLSHGAHQYYCWKHNSVLQSGHHTGKLLDDLLKHTFNTGMKLEMVSPREPFHIYPVSVTKVWSEYYFQVTEDDLTGEGTPFFVACHAHSPGILPTQWCLKNGVTLERPRGYPGQDFDWADYLKQSSTEPAPEACFPEVSMWLEAVNPLRPSQICVASVSQVKGRLLWLHLEGLATALPDYIVDVESMDIFPLGWCQANGYPLTPPHKPVCSANGKYCCSQIFVNHRCFSGPYLNKGRIAELPQAVGPGKCTLVLKEVLSMLINAAYKPGRVLRELQLVEDPHWNFQEETLKAKYKGKTYRSTIRIVRRSDQVSDFCRKVCLKLQCCPNLFSPLLITDKCPENCSVHTKTKYTYYYGKKKKVGLTSVGEASPDSMISKPARRRKKRKSIFVQKKRRSSAVDYTPAGSPQVSHSHPFSDFQKGVSGHCLNSLNPSPMVPQVESCEEEDKLVLDSNPLEWTVADVVQFIRSTDCAPLAKIFQEQDIDGQALLLLTLPTVQECMDLKLGPAIKLCHQIERVKVAFYAQYAN